MNRALKVAMVVVGIIFCAAVYLLVLMIRQEPALAMMMSLYVTLGVFLLLGVREPSTHRSLIAFTAWSSLAHATVMAVQAYRKMIPQSELVGVAVFAVVGVVFIVLAPRKQPVAQATPALARP